ncbi:SNF1-related protein kinase regulatory subunit gamma-1-like [Platanthera guangdongensis]|uniref:SNF1-related protein kinase regulatory subunit gamma-1-like n=1 Tax=Platanthera guangdongensis TaxID=2320717 RepID=A0ABR2M2D2_9ASPA
MAMRRHVHDFIAMCVVCQQNKVDHLLSAGLLQPLPVPTQIWADLSMDFVEGLSLVCDKSILMVVVDRFSKGARFIALARPLVAENIVQVFFQEIFQLHGMPKILVSDRDKVFISQFGKVLFSLSGTKLAFSSAYHPQSDGQTKVVNRTLEMYLRCITGDRPRDWPRWLSWIEYCYNTTYHTALQTTPFRLIYGRVPPRLSSCTGGSARVEDIDCELEDRDAFLQTTRNRLLQAQQYMEVAYNLGHRDLTFAMGDWGFSGTLHHSTAKGTSRSFGKLFICRPRFTVEVSEGQIGKSFLQNGERSMPKMSMSVNGESVTLGCLDPNFVEARKIPTPKFGSRQPNITDSAVRHHNSNGYRRREKTIYKNTPSAPSGRSHHVISIKSDELILEAFKIMKDNRIGGLPVLGDPGRKIVASLSIQDIRFLLLRPQLLSGFRHMTVRDFVEAIESTSSVLTCDSDALLGTVIDSLASRKVHRVYVEKGGEVVGVVTLRDVISCFICEPPKYSEDFFLSMKEKLMAC